MPEGFGSANRAEATDPVAISTHMRAKPAMHWNPAHRDVTAHSGVATCDIVNLSGRQDPHISEPATTEQHLVKCRHTPSGRVAAPARHSGSLGLWRIVTRFRRVSVGAAFLLAHRHTDKDFVCE